MQRAFPHDTIMTLLPLPRQLPRLIWMALFVACSLFLFRLASATEPREFVLTNGMKVLLSEVPKAPVATVQVWYKVGSRNELMGRAGLSHMLEHMMFKGTAKYPTGSLSPHPKKRRDGQRVH